MASKLLTSELQCRAATIPENVKRRLFRVGGGLFLCVERDTKGEIKKGWRLRHMQGGVAKSLSFGRYFDNGRGNGKHVSLAEAREWRDETLAKFRRGVDPVQEKKAAKQAADGAGFDSFRAIAERMIANKRGKITPKACLQFEQAFAHVYPAFGNRNIKSIGGREWLEAFQGIASRRNNRGEPMTYSALKTCQFVAQVYDYYNAENNDYIDNPCRAVIKLLARHKTANARRIDVADLPAFVCALRAYRGEFLTVCEFWLILYTGMRQASARRATWGDFDLDAATWNRKPEKHDENVLLLPLPKQAVALLREMRERARTEEKDGADWLLFHAIPKGGGNRPMSEETLNLALVRMGFDMTGHGLRGLVSTALNEYGFDARLVETQLGHKVQGVEGVYNKAQRLDERRDMMQRWADFLDALKDGKSEEEAREVFKAGAARPSAAETKKPASSDGGLWGKIFAEVYALTKDTAKATAAADRVAG